MEKNIFNINNNGLSYGRGYVYSLQYHLVWCTKYRKKVLKDGIDAECKEMLCDLAEEYKFQILAMEVMPDHIHLLVDCRPQFYISDMIKIMKGNIALRYKNIPVLCSCHSLLRHNKMDSTDALPKAPSSVLDAQETSAGQCSPS